MLRLVASYGRDYEVPSYFSRVDVPVVSSVLRYSIHVTLLNYIDRI